MRGSGNLFTRIVYGSESGNTLSGNSWENSIYRRGGNDKIYGEVGNDRLDGGGGNDSLDGGNGSDLLDGRDGKDQLAGSAGADEFVVNYVAPGTRNQSYAIRTDFSRDEDDLIKIPAGDQAAITSCGA